MIAGFISIILLNTKRIKVKITRIAVAKVEVIKTGLSNARVNKKKIPGIISKLNLPPDK
ncbi:MAG: hypothetical protein QG610_304 [Euryarchaeota archaeon]|nr:hypothetical protein [Euryarchaeota archaeon]